LFRDGLGCRRLVSLESLVVTILSILIVLAFLVTVSIERFGQFRRSRISEPTGPPAYERIKRVESPDGARALEILHGNHGLFRFDEMKWRETDIDDPYEAEGYWALAMRSGLYDSAAAAERDARAELAWFREMTGA
jgi:hypothetical protein